MCLIQLFEAMGDNTLPVCTGSAGNGYQGGLFDEGISEKNLIGFTETDISIIMGLHSEAGVDFTMLPPDVYRLFELSVNAFSVIIHAWMSEIPVTEHIIRFGREILESGDRQAADRAATDRIKPDVRAVHEAAYKVWHEYHRLMGLLRFSPDKNGVYVALCEPDHFILPALGPHFANRFGTTPWAIIDVKRCLCLHCTGGLLELFSIDDVNSFRETAQDGKWENLWRRYHTTINNESRNNPGLQKQFMPKRYWKYLTEMQ